MSDTEKYHYTEQGTGPPLLLLHGLFDSLQTWDDLAPLLSQNFKVYALDLPGFGKSPLPSDWPESLSGITEHLIAFLDDLDLERISLVGNSMGGSLSLALTQKYPERIHKIALLNPYGLPEVPQAVFSARRKTLGTILPYLLRAGAMKLCIKGIFSRSLYEQSLLTPTRIKRIAEPFSSLKQLKSLFRFLRAISPEQIQEIDRRLGEIRQAVLILWGTEDGWLTETHWQHLENRLPSAQVKKIEACGHLPQIEKPEVVAKALIPFFLEFRNKS